MKNKMIYSLIVSMFMLSCGAETNEEIATNETSSNPEEIIVQEQDEVVASAKDVDAEEFNTLITKGDGIILDVRTPGEYEGGFIEGAINIDYMGDNFEAEIADLDKSQPIYIYCQSGGRSSKAMKLMADKGFTNLYNLLGGYGGWPNK